MQLAGRVEKIPEAFKLLLSESGTRTPAGGWDRDKYGEGILDVEGLLNANLPPLIAEIPEHKEFARDPDLEEFFRAIINPSSSDTENLMDEIFDELTLNLITNLGFARIYEDFTENSLEIKEVSISAKKALLKGDIPDLLKSCCDLQSGK